MRLRGHVFVGLLFVVVAGPNTVRRAVAQEARDAAGTMLWISDIHFDPFYGGDVIELANDSKTAWCNHSEWGEALRTMAGNSACSPAGKDANDYLFQMVLGRAASELTRKPDCILITGDFLSHHFTTDYFSESGLPGTLTTAELYTQFVNQTLAYLALSVSSAFPDVPVVATLGNNDAYCGDYDVRGDSGFLAETRRTFRKYFLGDLSEDFQTYGGCYTTTIPKTEHKFVVLNSVPFVSDYPESYRLNGIPQLSAFCRPLRPVELAKEYKWLSDTMDQCGEEQRVWIVCHIPPGVACWNGVQNWVRPISDGERQIPFVNEFSDFYLGHRDHFAGILTGHSHAAEFKLIRDSEGRGNPVSFVLMAPSIGRNHQNNASFRVLSFDRSTLAIKDYATHWVDGSSSPARWGKPFRFTTTYGQPDVSPASLAAVFAGMKSGAKAPTGKTFLDQYFFDYSTRNGAKNSQPRTHYQKALGSIVGP
jgi:hypothetical protein